MIDGRRGRADAGPEAGEHETPDPAPEPVVGFVADPRGEQKVGALGAAGSGFVRALKSLGPMLDRAGVSADHVTVVGMLLAAVTGVVIGFGHFYAAVVLLTAGGLMDTLDGAVAKAAGTASKRGSFFDSVSDRVADMFIFGGLAWYFVGGPGHDPKMALIPFAILGVSNTISYERAKAESLGYVAKGGLMERAERLIALGVALLLHIVLVPVLLVILALCVVTGCQRFFRVWSQASVPAMADDPVMVAGPVPVPAAVAVAAGEPAALGPRRQPRVESRWRAWREASLARQPRRRVAVASRARSRRRGEPLSIRLRRAFQPERTGARTAPRSSARLNNARAERRRQGAESAFRRRLGSGSSR